MKRTINLLVLTHYFPPEVNAPAIRTFEHALSWVQNGVDVTILTNIPNHPHGRIFSGYENTGTRLNMQGIDIVRLKTFPTPNAGFSKRILNYIIYMVRAVWYGRKVKNADVIFASSPQFFCGVAGALLSKILNKPFVLEIRDIWPESIIAVGLLRNKFLIWILEHLEKWMVQTARQVVVVTKGIENHVKYLGHKEVLFIPNGVTVSNFVPDQKSEIREKIVIAYFGTIGLAHDVKNLVDAARHLENRGDIKFIIAGDGSEREDIISRSKGLSNVTIYPLLPHDELLTLLKKIDIGIVSLKDEDLFRGALPSKIFEYLAMEKPIILSVPEGEATALIRRYNCGLTIPPENANRLVDAIVKYANDPDLVLLHGRNGRRLVEHQFNREHLAMELLNKIIQHRSVRDMGL